MAVIKECDHRSVGILVFKDADLLLIERGRPPFGFAPPAGHVDADVDFEHAAIRELKEEVGLNADHLELLIEGRRENPCRRPGGNWHYWKIYSTESADKIERSLEETKQADYHTLDKIQMLAKRTKQYLHGQITEGDWEISPGIEPVWAEWFRELGILG